MYPACPICMNHSNKMVSCFSGCSFDCCLQCFNKILKLNEVDLVEYCCPQCRRPSIQSRDRRFDNFIRNNNRVLRRIIVLHSDKIKEQNNRLLSIAWNEFRNDDSSNIVMDGLTNEELANMSWWNN